MASESRAWINRLVTGLSPWRSTFVSASVHVRFVLEKVTLGKDPVVLRSSLANIIPPVLQSDSHLHGTFTSRTMRRSLRMFQK